MSHDELVMRAERWLQNQGCGVVIRDPFSPYTCNGEWPDAIGWRDGLSILVECKVSRADFLSDKRKPFRQAPDQGMGDWRFYLSPPDVVRFDDLPEGWGLIWAMPKTIRKVHGVPPNTRWWTGKPFTGNKVAENQVLASALRRFAMRGMLDLIYEPLRGAA